MSEILQSSQVVHAELSGLPCTVERFIGSGGQGEVYQANLNGQPIALKWYFPQYLNQDPNIRVQIENAINCGPPSDRFLWPTDLAYAQGAESFGYIMPLRESSYKGMIDLMKGRIEPTFRVLATVGFELADSFFQLHAKGLCYRDISWGNMFFDPNSGQVKICDNDNVDVDDNQKNGGVLGTPRFMAPEIVRGEAKPSTKTDLFSLAVLLFYMLMIHHPLEGKKEAEIHAFDLPAMTKLYGTEPIFIFDPNDDSNRPVSGYQDNALTYWSIYPQFLRDIFTKAFTTGLKDSNRRVQETEWRIAMVKLRDSIIYCPHCGAENFYDGAVLKTLGGQTSPCWSCKKEVPLPARMRIGKNTIMLNHDSQIFPHHVDLGKLFDFHQPVATLIQHPTDPNKWGLKNLSGNKWVTTAANGVIKDVEPGRSITLTIGTRINFGQIEGEIRV